MFQVSDLWYPNYPNASHFVPTTIPSVSELLEALGVKGTFEPKFAMYMDL